MSINETAVSWERSNDAVPEGIVQITIYDEGTGDRVATVFQTEANANLIIAAPDLREALIGMLRNRNDEAAITAGYEAIAKAEGL